MPFPTARITLDNNATVRGAFRDTASLRQLTGHGNGDIAQVYYLRRLYKFDPASVAADDDLDIIKPDDVAGAGRWVSTNQIVLSGVHSVASSPFGTIAQYTWGLVSEPSLGKLPAATLVPTGSKATLTIPTGADWHSGGLMAFLVVKDSDGVTSRSNAYDPFLNEDALFKYILRTPNRGLEVPPAGSRNWEDAYLRTFRAIDETIDQPLPTSSNKGMRPTGGAAGNHAVVPGIVLAQRPAGGSYIRVFVNGIAVEVGDGATDRECYFIDPTLGAPAGVRQLEDLLPGDLFVWNGTTAGFDLTTNDKIEFDYMVL